MAQYREVWTNPLDTTIIGYFDTMEDQFIPIDPANRDYQTFLTWQVEGGIADPAYTVEEIEAYQTEQAQVIAIAYLAATDGLIQRYRDHEAAGRRPFMPESKYLNLLKKRARAQKFIEKSFADFQ